VSTAIESITKLRQELRHFNIRASRAATPLDFRQLLETVDHCTIVKSNARRQVYFFQAAGRRFFLKRSTVIRAKDRFRLFLLPNRRKAEWRNLHRLAAMGITVPEPIVRGEAWHLKPPQYFILTSAVAGCSLQLDDHAQWRRLGEFVGSLHRRGIYHADLHPGNISLTPGGGHALLDVQSVFFSGRLPRFLKVRNIGRFLTHYLESSGFSDGVAPFLAGYRAGAAIRIEMADALASARAQLERHYRSRSKRCLKSSSEFQRVNDPGLKGFRRRGFDWDREKLKAALVEGRPLKSNSVIACQGVCIKRRKRRLFHADRCRTGWIMSRAMEVRRIEVPESLAYFACGHETYFLSEYIEGCQLLNAFLSGLGAGAEKRQALKDLAQWIRRIHSCRLYQRDFKSSNVLHRDGRYFLIDMESVIAGQPDDGRKLMNLAQLNASISNRVTLRDRLRFFHYYAAGKAWTRNRRRAAYRQIWKISSGKNTAVYGLGLSELLKEGGVGRANSGPGPEKSA
jgi:tRNA A-37 threonylcarbamoyl transferase component Bud32